MPNKNLYSKKAPTQRQLKVGEQLKRIISDLINSQKILEHYIGNILVVISEVQLSPDLKRANVFIMASGIKEKELTLKLLNDNAHRFASFLSKNTGLKYIPKLFFIYDDILDNVENINRILDSNKVNIDNED